jgi:hypothetical protein
MEKVQKCEVQEQSYVPSPESFKVYQHTVVLNYAQIFVLGLIKSVLKINPVHFVYSEPLLLIVLIGIILIWNYVPFVRICINMEKKRKIR